MHGYLLSPAVAPFALGSHYIKTKLPPVCSPASHPAYTRRVGRRVFSNTVVAASAEEERPNWDPEGLLPPRAANISSGSLIDRHLSKRGGVATAPPKVRARIPGSGFTARREDRPASNELPKRFVGDNVALSTVPSPFPLQAAAPRSTSARPIKPAPAGGPQPPTPALFDMLRRDFTAVNANTPKRASCSTHAIPVVFFCCKAPNPPGGFSRLPRVPPPSLPCLLLTQSSTTSTPFSNTHCPRLSLRPLRRMSVLHLDPPVLFIEDFVSADDCEALQAAAAKHPSLQASQVRQLTGGKGASLQATLFCTALVLRRGELGCSFKRGFQPSAHTARFAPLHSTPLHPTPSTPVRLVPAPSAPPPTTPPPTAPLPRSSPPPKPSRRARLGRPSGTESSRSGSASEDCWAQSASGGPLGRSPLRGSSASSTRRRVFRAEQTHACKGAPYIHSLAGRRGAFAFSSG